MSFEKRSDGKAIEHAVQSADLGSIIMAFNIQTEGKNKSPVIDVTSLLTSDVPEFSARRLASGLLGSRDTGADSFSYDEAGQVTRE